MDTANDSTSGPVPEPDPTDGMLTDQAADRVDHTDRFIACLESFGLTITRNSPVDFSAEPPPGAEEELMRIVEECKRRVGPAPERQFDRETAALVYQRWVATAACIEAAGYTPDPRPSLEAFADEFIAKRVLWHPSGRWFDALNPAEQEALKKQCPSWVA